eukprot:CAMPEP_0185275088 /NCGR_PEP_ID=MMETSP1359-20130426/53275_1 /TAXON_ID=552665 /ORGANISM="Bigelowiella longifila, Strain CCMP242" /LENGTH=301 /DNA_ID=CAMNT_0027868301 /DNA_START=38 /DNA_END=943 /DNA_ORIENTATION=+
MYLLLSKALVAASPPTIRTTPSVDSVACRPAHPVPVARMVTTRSNARKQAKSSNHGDPVYWSSLAKVSKQHMIDCEHKRQLSLEELGMTERKQQKELEKQRSLLLELERTAEKSPRVMTLRKNQQLQASDFRRRLSTVGLLSSFAYGAIKHIQEKLEEREVQRLKTKLREGDPLVTARDIKEINAMHTVAPVATIAGIAAAIDSAKTHRDLRDKKRQIRIQAAEFSQKLEDERRRRRRNSIPFVKIPVPVPVQADGGALTLNRRQIAGYLSTAGVLALGMEQLGRLVGAGERRQTRAARNS